jgi:hypothetical protein
MLTESCSKDAFKFNCKKCDYNTSKKSSYDKHLLTSKHLKLTTVNTSLTESCQNISICNTFLCQNCNKEYKSRVGLWKHNKLCTDESKNICQYDTTNIIMMLIKENSELKNLMIEQSKETNEFKNIVLEQQNNMMEVIKNGTHNTTNTHTNSHNKAFNLNFFLNETCKDAMNLMDFVDSIKLQLSDLEKVGEVGFVEGISNIIVKNLNSLDETKRPIHCTDAKREVLYVKDDNKWEKEEEEKNKLRKVIKKIAHKNSRQLINFKESHPDCGKSVSPFSDQYNKLVIEAYGGKGEDYDNENKIIKKIAKEVIVEKDK